MAIVNGVHSNLQIISKTSLIILEFFELKKKLPDMSDVFWKSSLRLQTLGHGVPYLQYIHNTADVSLS